MTRLPRNPNASRRVRSNSPYGVFTIALGTMLVCGCTALNPAFVDLIDGGNGSSFVTIPNPPGHVVVTVVNRTTVDEQLLTYLTAQPGFPAAGNTVLRPRIRMRLRVTYSDGTFQTMEFITGSKNLIDPAFGTQAVPDLNQNDLDNVVVLCDVASVTVEPGSAIEVFVPAALQQYELVQTQNPLGGVDPTLQRRNLIPPQFRALQVDDVDADGNTLLRRNIGVRDAPAPTPNVVCGSVVAVIVDGVLSVPFLAGVDVNAPSYDINDANTVAGIGGRYEFLVTVQ